VCEALKQLSVTGVRIVGIAKGPERRVGYEALIRADTGEVLRPDAHDPGFHMVQRIRDEAHRFAIGGHRGRRERARSTACCRTSRASAPSGAARCCGISAGCRGC
jgi:excinuclease ABC subunit C